LQVLRLCCLEGAVAAVELGRADEALLAQLLEALQVRTRLFGVDARCFEARARRLLAEAKVERVEAGQHLTDLHRVTQIDRPRDHLACHAKRQARLASCAHLAGVVDARARSLLANGDRAHRAHRLGRRRGRRARRSQSSEQQCKG
jgi:hypothetical protein